MKLSLNVEADRWVELSLGSTVLYQLSWLMQPTAMLTHFVPVASLESSLLGPIAQV